MTASGRAGQPQVSVVMATYNYSSVLRYALATVLWQTFEDFEVIVVGDCCTDDSEEVVRSFDDPRVRWLNLGENSGSKSIPQNAGIDIARGPYIAYLAHDDLWHPSHLETVVRAIEQNGADLVYSLAVFVPPPGESVRLISGVFPEGHFRAGYSLVHSSVIHRKALITELGGWPDYRVTQMTSDEVFWMRAVEAGKRFEGVPKLTTWKFNASSRPNSYRDRRCDEQARYFQLLRDDPSLAEKELIDLARSAMVHGLSPLETHSIGRDAPPGSYIQFLREIRGLEPVEPMAPIRLRAGESPFRIDVVDAERRAVRVRERFEIEVRIQNDTALALTSHAPHPVHLAYHWLYLDGSCAVYEGERTNMVPPLPPRASRHYFARVQAPGVPGSYQFQPALVQEAVQWFDQADHGNLVAFEVRGGG